jgi:hypothetical protein
MVAKVIEADPSKRICGRLYRKEPSALFEVFGMQVRMLRMFVGLAITERRKGIFASGSGYIAGISGDSLDAARRGSGTG